MWSCDQARLRFRWKLDFCSWVQFVEQVKSRFPVRPITSFDIAGHDVITNTIYILSNKSIISFDILQAVLDMHHM